MTSRDEQRERREIIENDLRQGNPEKGDTYFGRAQIDSKLESPGGRFAALAKPTFGGPQYPAQPSTSPWSADPVGPEPPLGHCVDAMELVGTEAEIERLLIEPSKEVRRAEWQRKRT